MLVKNVHWLVKMKKKDNEKTRTCICLDALEFVFIHICEERSIGPVSGTVAALSHITCLPLDTKTHTQGWLHNRRKKKDRQVDTVTGYTGRSLHKLQSSCILSIKI